mgnify:CR=1 FL=1
MIEITTILEEVWGESEGVKIVVIKNSDKKLFI